MIKHRGFESYNKFLAGIKDLKQIYDFTYHLYIEENQRLEDNLPDNGTHVSFSTIVGSTTHDLTSLYIKSKNRYPLKLRQLVLISLITTLEVYFTDTVKEAFERDIKFFLDEGVVEFQKNFIMTTPSIDRLRNSLIMKDVRTLTSGGLSISKKYYKKKFKIDFLNLGLKFKEIQEIHDRRHLHVHRNGLCDLEYEKKYSTYGFISGDYLNIQHEYLIESIEKIKSFASIINAKIIEKFPDIKRKTEYVYGNARYEKSLKKIILEFDVLESSYDHRSYFNELKIDALSFGNYIVQYSAKDNKCLMVLVGEPKELYRFFKPLKLNNKLNITNIIELRF